VEVGVSAVGPASAPLSGAAAATPPAGTTRLQLDFMAKDTSAFDGTTSTTDNRNFYGAIKAFHLFTSMKSV
jgi:hypothetical protein